MAGMKGRSGGARAGSGRPSTVRRLERLDPAVAMDYLVALFEAAMRGRISAAAEYLRAGGHFRKPKNQENR